MKACTQCNELKSLNEYDSNKNYKDGLAYHCKKCIRANLIIYRRTKKGLISSLYNNQRARCRKRNHSLPEYTLKELIKALSKNKKFNNLFNNWVINDYAKKLCPSIDRINDYLGYTKTNIQIMTWEENDTKGHKDRRLGINNKASKKVNQYTLEGKFINSYHSLAEAQRHTGVNTGGISETCRDNAKTAGGFKWKYVK